MTLRIVSYLLASWYFLEHRYRSAFLMRSALLHTVLGCVLVAALTTLLRSGVENAPANPDGHAYDPLAIARASIGKTVNTEATVPPQCYTRTAGISNPCWTCHTQPLGENRFSDWLLQEAYTFSDLSRTNRWKNLFTDRRAAIKNISDAEALDYIRADNYTPLRAALHNRQDYPGYVPDLDFRQGFDGEGFARDSSGWRAIRYKPFPGTFWPTNGSTDDVMIRLPRAFQTDGHGRQSRQIYKLNLAILEGAIAVDPSMKDIDREVEPLNEKLAGIDLDGDGTVQPAVTRLRTLPAYYIGAAHEIAVHRYLYPQGTEFLHTVRYIDSDVPSLLSTRMKEVRYARKVEWLDDWARLRAYEHERDEKEAGLSPFFPGSPLVGLRNIFGWQFQGFIEDAAGQLRLQTEEEHLFCLGCHTSLGVTVDRTFAFARKVPGIAGWRHQSVHGIPDVPQVGHQEPEILTYFQRVQGGDEFRANTEVLERFFLNGKGGKDGKLDTALVRRAAPGGDRDIAFLIAPSRKRALLLNKAAIVLVREQSFALGRDPVLAPTINVHTIIQDDSTGLAPAGRIYRDGRLWLNWSALLPYSQKR